ncbi:glycosyltransferase family 4 protein [Paenibacillus yanchengensis]|uniref:Glycosyltransferase family 4 protein n=1 Tax=Paenibacillus yanchengensis TaxID=2035833 RepID=A0ABW4YKL5_9BACL
MKILQALFFPPEQPGGVSSMVPYITEGFKQADWNMELFSLPKRVRGKGQDDIHFYTFDFAAFAGNPLIEKYVQTYRDYLWWARMRLQGEYDIIHAHHPLVALTLKRLFPHTPLIVTIHSSYEQELILNHRIEENGIEHRFLTALYGELEARVDVMLTVSQSFKQYLSAYIKKPEAIQVIANGFDERRFQPIQHDNETIQLITVCRLVPAKGLDTLLQACAIIKQRGHSFVLHVIGDGPIREQLEQLAIDEQVYDEIIFYGYMLHPEQFMPFSDIFVLPSKAEAFGSVFAEAALCRLALVGTDVGGIAEQIEHNYNGLLVQPDDPIQLADTLEKLITNKQFRQQMAYAAWEKAKTDYSLKRVIDQLEQVYSQLLT